MELMCVLGKRSTNRAASPAQKLIFSKEVVAERNGELNAML